MTRFTATKKRLEHELPLFRRNARSVVEHVDARERAGVRDPHADAAAGRRELDRVRDEIVDRDTQLARIAGHLDRLRVELDVERLALDLDPVLCDRALDEPARIERYPVETRCFVLPRAEIQQVLDVRLQLQPVLLQNLRDLLLRRLERSGRTLGEQVRALTQARERGLQLV